MKMKKVKLTIVMISMLSLFFTSTIYAKTYNNGEDISTQTELFEVQDNSLQPRMMCSECESIIEMRLICLPDTREISGTRVHKYGFLGTKSCTITSKDAKAAYFCDFCRRVDFLMDPDQEDGYARHHCLEIHSSCGAGDNGYYRVCPFEG